MLRGMAWLSAPPWSRAILRFFFCVGVPFLGARTLMGGGGSACVVGERSIRAMRLATSTVQ